MDSDLAQKAAAAARVIDVNDIPSDTSRLIEEIEVTSELKSGEIVLDVRAPDDAEKTPLSCEHNEVMRMPFYKVAKEFPKLDQVKTYCLFCDQGVMSTMQSRQLKEMGYHNVKVYRPEI